MAVSVTTYRMPAEWNLHEATWIAWPHEKSDFPGKLPSIDWVYAEIVRVLAQSERVEILCHNEAIRSHANECLQLSHVSADKYRLHVVANDRSWLRDSMPTAVFDAHGKILWMSWQFRAWAKYDNYSQDAFIPDAAAEITGLSLERALRPDTNAPLTLEGGAIETDGEGTLLTTEECLLSEIQERNPGLSREGYERAFAEYLGIEKVIWLGAGCAGDDTHGHIDDIARFVAPGKVVLAYEDDPAEDNFEASQDNLARLERAVDARGRKIEVLKLPMPRPIFFGGERLPASYANFYIANTVVLVPTFNDPKDLIALQMLQTTFPDRQVVGIHAVDLVLGQGTLHCLTQQQPRANPK